MIIPALAIPLSIAARSSSLLKGLPSVNIATISPSPTATIGCPRKIRTFIMPSVLPIAVATVLISMSTIGRSSGANDSNVPGTPDISMLNAAS